MKTSYLIILFCIVSAAVTSTLAYRSHEVYTENSFRTFDGVMYEFQRVRRYEKLAEGSGLGNRIGSAILEAKGNPNSGGYHAILCLLFPKSLITGHDLLVRSFLGLSFLFILLFHLLKESVHPWRFLLMVLGICLLPGLTHTSYGIGSYIPDAVANIYLVCGLLSLLLFLRKKKYYYILLASFFAFMAIAMRLNAVIYFGFFILPYTVAFLNYFKLLSIKKLLKTLAIILLVSTPIVIYSLPKLDWLIDYNNNLGYGRVALNESLHRSFQLFLWLMGKTGILLCLFFLVLGITTEIPKKLSLVPLLSLLVPFLFIYSLVIVWRRVPEVPHVLNACYLFLPLAFLVLGMYLRPLLMRVPFKIPIKFALTALLFAILTFSLYSKYQNILAQVTPKDQKHLLPKAAAEFVQSYLGNTQKGSASYLFLFEEMLNIPIQVHLYKAGLPFFEVPHSFFFQKSLLKSSGHCPSVLECADYYSEIIKEMDVIGVNDLSKQGNSVRSAYPFADSIAQIVEIRVFKDTTTWQKAFQKSSSYHGDVAFFIRK